jgi:hypothetical protein
MGVRKTEEVIRAEGGGVPGVGIGGSGNQET